MTREAWPWGLIHTLANTGASATAALKEFRTAGGHMADKSWYRMWGEVQNELSLGGIEASLDLGSTPTQAETITMTTVRASGYMQRVNIFAKNASGEVFTKTIDLRGDDLLTREQAIRAAEIATEELAPPTSLATGSDVKQILGAVYAGTYELTPG